jgi:hypothetical protein
MLLGVTLQVHCILIKITRKVTPLLWWTEASTNVEAEGDLLWLLNYNSRLGYTVNKRRVSANQFIGIPLILSFFRVKFA